MVLNPGRRRLKGGEAGVFMATSQAALNDALTRRFSRPLHPSDPRHYLDPPMPAVSLHNSPTQYTYASNARLDLPVYRLPGCPAAVADIAGALYPISKTKILN